MGRAQHMFWSKGQISLNFFYKVKFIDFLYQTLRVFSQIQNLKHIKREFRSVTWVMPSVEMGLWDA